MNKKSKWVSKVKPVHIHVCDVAPTNFEIGVGSINRCYCGKLSMIIRVDYSIIPYYQWMDLTNEADLTAKRLNNEITAFIYEQGMKYLRRNWIKRLFGKIKI